MIPAGFENSKLYFGDSDDFSDEDDNFIFESKSKKPEDQYFAFNGGNNVISKTDDKMINDKSSSEVDNNYQIENSKNSVPTRTKCANFFHELNNNYYFDESSKILDDLKSAILNLNLGHVENLMKKNNLNANCLLKGDWTPIMYASMCGSFELVEYFVKNGADVNFSHDSYNVLMCACGSNDLTVYEFNLVKIVDLLLKKGADVNSCDKYFQTPLMYASRAQNSSLIDLLVKFGAKVDAQDDNNWTSLSHASHNGSLKCVKKLLNYNANPVIHTTDYLYAFDLAKNGGHDEIYKLLKNYMRMKRIEESKENGILFDFFDDDFEDQDDGLTNETSDLEAFLGGIRMKNLVSLFKTNKVNLKKLLTYRMDDLKQIGIKEEKSCQLIVSEINKFHQKNWQPTSLIPIRNDSTPNCNEAIAMISNISRHMDYMSSNVKYVQIGVVEENKEIFADDFTSGKFKIECKIALNNCKDLLNSLNSLCEIVQKKVKIENAEPIDRVGTTKKTRFEWLKSGSFRMAALSTTILVSTYFVVKTKKFIN